MLLLLEQQQTYCTDFKLLLLFPVDCFGLISGSTLEGLNVALLAALILTLLTSYYDLLKKYV